MNYLEIPVQADSSADDAKIELYLLDTPADKIHISKRPVIVICPGGGYEKLSYREGEPLAVHFLNQGYHACILRYSVKPATYPAALLELGMVMKLLHERAQEWKIDVRRIVIHGASAGGHLAAHLGVSCREEWLCTELGTIPDILTPAGLMLSYPVITSREEIAHMPSFRNLLGERFEELKGKVSIETQVKEWMPPVFLWHTMSDRTVPVENSLLMAAALKAAGVPAELHVFPEGEHGLSLASDLVERPDGSGVQKQCRTWIYLADAWLLRLWEQLEEKRCE